MPPFPNHDGPYSKDVNQNKPFLSSLSCFAQHFVRARRTATKVTCGNKSQMAEGHHHRCHTTLLLSSSPLHTVAGCTGIMQNCREPVEVPSPEQPTEKAPPGTSKQPGFLNRNSVVVQLLLCSSVLIYRYTLQACGGLFGML